MVGVAVIVDALSSAGQQLGQLLVGTLLIGIIPVDELLDRVGKRGGGERN